MKAKFQALLGRNGAGKSTTLKSLMGVVAPRSGTIKLDGIEISGKKSHAIARAGMQLVHEERRIFGSLDVEENLVLAGLTAQKKWPLERIYGIFPRLKQRRRSRGTDLSGGEQQMLAIARALVVNPQLLLLDEPMEGLAPVIVQDLLKIIRELASAGGMAVILVEQHARLALGVTKRAVVLDRGRIVHRSESDRLLASSETLHRLVAVS